LRLDLLVQSYYVIPINRLENSNNHSSTSKMLLPVILKTTIIVTIALELLKVRYRIGKSSPILLQQPNI